jgi:hypothetical protein
VQCAGAIFVNAALTQRIVRPPGCPWVDVYFNAGDEITEAARIGAALGLTDLVWGEMGHAGYFGNDLRITNTNCGPMNGSLFSAVGPIGAWGHSDIFTPPKIRSWGPYIAQRLKARLS